jgi:hypothetical protein
MQSLARTSALVFAGAGGLLFLSLAPSWPKEQRLRLTLGDRAPRVEEVRVRCGAAGTKDTWATEVMFHYAKGQAPRIVSYEPRLKSGEYLVEVEVETDDARVQTTDRRVRLDGSTVSFDLSRQPFREEPTEGGD